MYYYLLVLLLAGCVCADVPDYLGALSNTNMAIEELEKNLNRSEPEHYHNSYLVLLAAVGSLADMEQITGLTYNSTYAFVKEVAVAIGEAFPEFVLKLTQVRIELVQKLTANITKLIHNVGCTKENSKDTCNEVVDELVKEDSMIVEEAPVLLAFGDLGFVYLGKASKLMEVAYLNAHEQYLEDKEEIRYLVKQLLEADTALESLLEALMHSLN